MGIYINKGNDAFRKALNGEYIDKSGLIAAINRTLDSERQFTCVTRCRRFGKSMAVDMLRAYYDKSCNSRNMFSGLGIVSYASFETHLNKYPVISLDVTDFTTRFKNDRAIVRHINDEIKDDILTAYPDVNVPDKADLMQALIAVYQHTGQKFIMLIDEWDAIMREFDTEKSAMDDYVNMLRRLFKGGSSKEVFAGVYMTGILPIKRYNTQSALNNFREYSVVIPGVLDQYFGFSPSEVEIIAENNGMNLQELKDWYDGYRIGKEQSVYNPYSVMEAVSRGFCDNYWAATSAYYSISTYINMNYEGLKDDIIYMLGGGRCDVDCSGFENDTAKVKSKDDVLTILIHLGYLAYDREERQCYIPNKEIALEMEKAVKACSWEQINKVLNASKQLLTDTLRMNEEAVAKAIDLAHDENTSILSYNDENSLACVLSLAYIWVKNDYIVHRELATGKGFADLILIPRRTSSKPAIVIELKYDKNAVAAIDQIKQKNYPAKVVEYTENLLLVGINYDKETKGHSCKIEKYQVQDKLCKTI